MNRFFLRIQCVICFSTFVSCTWDAHVDSNDTYKPAKYVQRKWITQLMDEAKYKFNFDSTVNEKCRRDFQLYQQHLQNLSIWAVRMLESSEWPTVGVYAASTYSMGNWDECLRLAQYDVKGQYCLVQATYDWRSYNRTEDKYTWPDERASTLNALEIYKNMPWLSDRQNLHWALCIPASCQPSEIASSLNRTLHPIFENQGMSVEVNVDPKLCSKRNEGHTFSQGFYIFCGFAALLILLVISATIWHGEVQGLTDCEPSKTSANSPSIIESFSIFYNMKMLTKRSSELPRLHLWKTTYMILCVVAHRILLNIAYPRFNMEGRELTSFRKDDFNLGFRFLFIVDIFCVFSGFFTYHYGSSRIKLVGFLYVILSIIRRWIRMVPVFSIIILFIIYVLPYLSNGPFWNYRIYEEVESCKATFWYFFFGVNNIFETNKLCLLTSWYVSVDLQTAIVGDLLLYLISRKKSLGIIATVALFLSTTIACSIIVYINGFHAILQANERNFSNLREWGEFTNFYIKTYNRLPMFLMGFLTAVLMHHSRLRDYKVTNVVIIMWTMSCLLLKTSIMFYVEQFFDFIEPYDKLKHALNALVPRFIFFIPDCWLLVICFKSVGGEFAVRYLDHHLFTIVGRLMYCFYVVHIVLLMFHATSSQMLIPTTNLATGWTSGGDILYTLLASLGVYLFIAAPISNLENICLEKFLRKRSSGSKQQTNTLNDTKFPDENKISNGKSLNLNQLT